MKFIKNNSILLAIYFLVMVSVKVLAAPVLIAERPIALPGVAGHFDFMAVDSSRQRLLAAHTGTRSLTVLDLKSGKVLKEISIGAAQGVTVNIKDGLYVVGDEDEKKIVIVDARSLTVVSEIAVSGPVDAIVYNPKNGMIYADRDDGREVWVVDPKIKKVVATIKIPGVPEFIEYDSATNRIYQNLKSSNEVVVIDPTKNEIEANWSTIPALSPHGLAVDEKHGHLFIAGANGILVGINVKTGKIYASVEIVKHVDQIALDKDNQVIYCAGRGYISVIKPKGESLKVVGKIPSPHGSRTLAIDPKTHDVWVSYADKKHSYLQKFKPAI